VAASTYLAFSMTATPGAAEQAPAPVTIDSGTRVQSIPAAGALPQTFETVEQITARVEWNSMQPALTQPQIISATSDQVLIQGAATGIKPGDAILIVPADAGSSPVLRAVASITAIPAAQQTRIELQPRTVSAPSPPRPLYYYNYVPPFTIARDVAQLVGFGRPSSLQFRGQQRLVYEAADVRAFGEIARFRPAAVFRNLRAWSPPVTPSVFAFRTRASLFGYNAPDLRNLSKDVQGAYSGDVSNADWDPSAAISSDQGSPDLNLDTVYSKIVATTPATIAWAAVKWRDRWVVGTVGAVSESGVAHYGLTGKATQINLVIESTSASFVSLSFSTFSDYRAASVFAESEALTLARLPIDDPVGPGDEIDLDDWIDGLYAGQRLIVSGELDTSRGNYASEMVQIESVQQILDAEGGTHLTLSTGLQNAYVRSTVTINGNVALATHGQAVDEVLGSGDASQSTLRLTLRQSPLTYTSGASSSGATSTLQVRVNTVRWDEVPTLYGARPADRVYATRRNDDGSTTVIFGDGSSGARPPTAAENITAHYRKGIGVAGNLDAGQLTLLAVRPLGVNSVTNPLSAAGGADPESADDIRSNAALKILTLDRIVSLSDYEDFARAFGGIGKALATWSFHRDDRGVFLTVAGVAGASVETGSVLYTNLLAAIADSAEPNVSVVIQSYRKAFFTLSATLYVDPHYEMDLVLAAAQQQLRDRYSFAARAFGQPVSFSEVVTTLQAVAGVSAVEVNSLQRTDRFLGPLVFRSLAAPVAALLPGLTLSRLVQPQGLGGPNTSLAAALPETGPDSSMLAAELLVLDPRPVHLVGVFA
jgi:hypothetical protein